MATQKKSVAAPTSRALEHGAKAAGARFLKKGISFTPELDLAFALGHGSGFAPIALLPDLKPGKASKTRLERNVAISELRLGFKALMNQVPFLENPEPIDDVEAKKILAREVPLLNFTPRNYLALESMVGPSLVLSGIVEALDGISTENWNNARTQSLFFVLKGFLLRALPAEEKAARAELEALLKKKDKTFAAANLDILLHGRPAIAKRGYKYSSKFKSFQRNDSADPSNVSDLLRCDDDAEWIADQFSALWTALNFKPQKWMAGPSPARLFFLAGDAALQTELKAAAAYPGTMHADAFESYQHLASPLARQLMQRLSKPDSKVQKQAQAWLAEHP